MVTRKTKARNGSRKAISTVATPRREVDRWMRRLNMTRTPFVSPAKGTTGCLTLSMRGWPVDGYCNPEHLSGRSADSGGLNLSVAWRSHPSPYPLPSRGEGRVRGGTHGFASHPCGWFALVEEPGNSVNQSRSRVDAMEP